MNTSLLTIGRRAVWQAIDNWPALDGAFRAKYRGDREYPEALSLRDGPTSQNELPAISIAPATNELTWLLGQLGQNEYGLAVTIWTPGWEWTLSEALWEECVRAIARCSPEGNSRKTYVSRPVQEGGTGHYPRFLDSRFTRIRIGSADNELDNPKALAHTFGVALRLNMQLVV